MALWARIHRLRSLLWTNNQVSAGTQMGLRRRHDHSRQSAGANTFSYSPASASAFIICLSTAVVSMHGERTCVCGGGVTHVCIV